jgi:hypothetical protein
LEVALTGDGWVLLGLQGPTFVTGSAGLRFVRRDLGKDRTVFAFHAERLGEYAASFQRQLLATGAVDSSRVQIRVVPPEDLASYLAGQKDPAAGRGSPVAEGERDVARAAADRLYSLGLNKAALEEYRKLAPGGASDPEITNRMAQLHERLGNQADALSQWSLLLAAPEYRERATAGVVRAAAVLGDGARVASNLDALYGIRGFPIGKELVEVARYAERSGQNALELTVLEEYLARYPMGAQGDEVSYRLGGLLERAWEGRDLTRSRQSYEAVLRDYPTSSYALASGDRVDYLKRHFFYVR